MTRNFSTNGAFEVRVIGNPDGSAMTSPALKTCAAPVSSLTTRACS